jgi:anti-sigma B factor antagonist
MQVEHNEEFGKVILSERVDLTNAGEFKEALQSLYEQGCSTIKVDCSKLTLIDSAGLGSLVMYQKKLTERGGELKLVNVNHNYIKNLFDMIELNRVINIENSY